MFQIRHETSKNTRGQREGDFTAKPKIFCITEDDRSNIGLSKALQIFFEMFLYVLGRVELANGTVGSKNQPRKHRGSANERL
jgi:hypothetical protein